MASPSLCSPVSERGIIVPTFPGKAAVRIGDEMGKAPGPELVCVGVPRIVAATIGDPDWFADVPEPLLRWLAVEGLSR